MSSRSVGVALTSLIGGGTLPYLLLLLLLAPTLAICTALLLGVTPCTSLLLSPVSTLAIGLTG